MKLHKIIILLISFLVFQVSKGQNDIRFNTLSESDKINFKKLAVKNINELGQRLKIISSVKNNTIRKKLIDCQLEYFTEKAIIETGYNDERGKLITNRYKVYDYLNNTINNYQKKYKFLEIEFISFHMGDLKPVPGEPNKYYFNYTFKQRFSGKYKNSIINNKNAEGITQISYDYEDETKKNGTIYVYKKNTVLGSKWKLLFGDIKVEAVKKL